MRIQTHGAGPHPDVSIAGSVLTAGDLTIDCAKRQDDLAVMIDLRRDGAGPITEGGGGRQLASVAIPPRSYETVDTGDVDDSGDPVLAREPTPLAADQVLVTLWTIPTQGA